MTAVSLKGTARSRMRLAFAALVVMLGAGSTTPVAAMTPPAPAPQFTSITGCI